MIYLIIAFFSGVIGLIIGIFIIGILSTGKQADMWKAIEDSAYRNDNSLCKSLLEMDVEENIKPLKEGNVRKDGVNPPPTKERPKTPPPAQKPLKGSKKEIEKLKLSYLKKKKAENEKTIEDIIKTLRNRRKF